MDANGSASPCVEEAIQLVASRDAVYLDPCARVWRNSIPAASPIRTRLGLGKCVAVRASDGVVVCSHPSGALFLSPLTVTRTREGELIDASLLPTDRSDGEDGAGEPDEPESGGGRRARPTQVDLRGCELEHQDVVRLTRALVGNFFITSLALSGNHLGDSDVALVADALAHTSSALETLLLSYNAVGALGSTLLAAALRGNERLRLLDLSHNRVGPEGVRPWLGSTLRVNRALLELRLNHNGIGDAKASELLSALAPKPTTQEAVLKAQLARRRHTAAVAATSAAVSRAAAEVERREPAAAEEEPFNSSLTTLSLADTGIGDEAARHLAHALTKTRVLTHLDVSCNAFGSQGVRLLSLALERNESLRSLVFDNNVVQDDEAAAVLLRAVGTHPSLETARFQGCFPTGHATVAAATADLLRSTQSIATLDLSHCLFEPPAAADVYCALSVNRSLRCLELSCTGLRSDGAAAALARALGENEALETLDVSYNALTLRGCKLLRDAAHAREEQQKTRRRLSLRLEGNSGEQCTRVGVTVSGGLRYPLRASRQGEEAEEEA